MRESFPAIQASWSGGKAHALEPYVSTSLGDRLARELAALRRDGVVNRVEDAQLREVTALPTKSGGPVVEIVFTARDWLADLSSGRVIDGDPQRVASFRQRWHLLQVSPRKWLLDEIEPR